MSEEVKVDFDQNMKDDMPEDSIVYGYNEEEQMTPEEKEKSSNEEKVEQVQKEEDQNVPYMKIKEYLDPGMPIVIWDNSRQTFLSLIDGRQNMCEHLKKRVDELYRGKLKEGESEVFSIYVVNDFIKRCLFNYRLEVITNEKGGLQIVLGVLDTMKRVMVKELRNMVKEKENK